MIYLGADHGGFELKEKMKQWLLEKHIDFVDMGAFSLTLDDDYPDFAREVAEKITLSPNEDRGILICRSGGGMVIAANRYSQVRAVYVFNEQSAVHARQDNNANIASFAADWIDDSTAKTTLFTFLNTAFSDKERHIRRVAKLDLV